MNRERIKIDLLIHDLKVPLAVIGAGITSLLNRQEKYGTLTQDQERVLIRVLRNTKTTQTLVNDALELARSREGIVNPVNLRLSSLIEQALVEIFDLADSSISEKIRTCADIIVLREALEERGIILHIDE
ncbi:MAG TPA: histidine kinase dimerization/phospho-acceptor domain-containing protein [Acidobacteriota bacterium]|nr:histidine kinase dimerization/phospho-acceptor domain-containing protein [Acidobacteriota bacterium]